MRTTTSGIAAALLLGCLLGSVWHAVRRSDVEADAAIQTPVAIHGGCESTANQGPARVRFETRIQSRIHPLVVAAGIALFSTFALVVFPGRVEPTAPTGGRSPRF